MPLPLPPWITEAEEKVLPEEYPRSFFYIFKDRRHFDYFQQTGELRHPNSAAAADRLAADPIKKQREVLRKRISEVNRAIRAAEAKIAAARDARGSPFASWQPDQTIRDQTIRIAERQGALRDAELNLQLFDAFHPTITQK